MIYQENKMKNKKNRQDELCKLLLSNAKNTIKELSDIFSVDIRTISRDIRELKKQEKLIKVDNSWKKNPSSNNIAPDDKVVLNILSKMAKTAGTAFSNKADYLLNQIDDQIDSSIYTNISYEPLDKKNLKLFSDITDAIKNRTEIKFNYEKESLTVKPLKLAIFDGFHYLFGFEKNSNNDIFRKFRFLDIMDIDLSEKNVFEISSETEINIKRINSAWFDYENKFDVKLLVNADTIKYFKRKPLKTQFISGQDKSGAVEITISVSHEMEIIPLVLWWIPNVKILEPDWLSRKMEQKIEAYLKELK